MPSIQNNDFAHMTEKMSHLFLKRYEIFFPISVFILLSVWLKLAVPNPDLSGAYTATGRSSLTLYAGWLGFGLLGFFQAAVFVATSMIIYTILRLSLSFLLAFFSALIFVTNAQFVLVYFSGPLWDMSSFLFPMMVIAYVFISLSKYFGEVPLNAKVQIIVVSMMIFANSLMIFLPHLISSIPVRTTSDSVVNLSVILLSILMLVDRNKLTQKSGFLTKITFENSQVLFVPVIATMTMIQPWIGRSKTSISSIIIIVCYFVLIFSKTKINIALRSFFAIGYLALFYFTFIDGSSIPYFFYTFYGQSSASQLVSGLDASAVSYGTPHVDEFVWQAFVANAKFPLSQLITGIFLNFPSIALYLKISWIYISEGIWRYSENPIGLENNAIFEIRSIVIYPLRFISPSFFILSVIILWRKSLKVTIFLLLLCFLFLALISISRPQMHQFWPIQVVGLWGFMFATQFLVSKVKLFSSLYRVYKKRYLIARNSLKNLSLIHLLVLWFKRFSNKKQFFLLLLFFLPTLFLSLVTFVSPKIQATEILNVVKFYESHKWDLVVSKNDSSIFLVAPGTNLIKVTTSQSCTLSELRFGYSNPTLLKRSSLNGSTDYYRTKFYISNTSSQVAYFPKFSSGIDTLRLWIAGLSERCHANVYQTRIITGRFPLIAILVPHKTYFKSNKLSDNTVAATELRSKSVRRDLVEVDGYVKNSGYQSVGDESSYNWLSQQVGDRILGRSRQGYQSIDLWSDTIQTNGGHLRIQFAGKISRGVIALGWVSKTAGHEPFESPNFDYQVFGSSFEVSLDSIRACFELGTTEKHSDVGEIDLFVSAVSDLYSAHWTKVEIESLTIDQGACPKELLTREFKPSL